MRFVTLFLLLLFVPIMVFTQSILYEEHVTGGTLDNTWYPGYAPIKGTALVPHAMAGNPSGDGWVGRLFTDSTGFLAQTYSGEIGWTDFYYEAQVYLPVTGSPALYYALEFRVDSAANTVGYSFASKASEQKLYFRARTSGMSTTINTWDNAQIPGGFPTQDGWHKMAVKAEGNQFWFYFDDQELPGCPITDNTYTNGWIGVYVMAMSGNYDLYVDDLIVTDTTATSIEDNNTYQPNNLHLSQNYPNPFNPTTTIEFNLEKADNVKLVVFNSAGELVKTLADNQYSAGTHQIKWDATDLSGSKVSAGVYLYSLQTSKKIETKKMILLK